ncbi:MAG: hypothetical protein ACRDQZ_03455 [Mycobacteriales bacterium]
MGEGLLVEEILDGARIVGITLAEAGVDPASFPEGTSASRCTGCGESRLSYPGDLTDEWKKHFDYCDGQTTDRGESHSVIFGHRDRD